MKIRIVEVGPRDGLQNLPSPVSLDLREALVRGLRASGLSRIEIGAFVSPKWVPQMAESFELCERFSGDSEGLMALVPNRKGFESFSKTSLSHIAFFTAVSDAFNLRNTKETFRGSLDRFKPLVEESRNKGFRIRLYLSTVFDCPLDGAVSISSLRLAFLALATLGVHEISLGDTLGKATPSRVSEVTSLALEFFQPSALNYHFHDTYGMAMANVSRALSMGVTSFDSSLSGLGGCPYAPGAGGNLATEDLVYFCKQEGLDCGVDLEALVQVASDFDQSLERKTESKAQKALRASIGSEI
jgi:hydroxymethylglutaryl-CoA lyase